MDAVGAETESGDRTRDEHAGVGIDQRHRPDARTGEITERGSGSESG